MKLNMKKALKNDYLLTLSLLFCIIGVGLCVFFSCGPRSYRHINLNLIQEFGIQGFVKTADFVLLLVYALLVIVGLVCFAKRLAYIKSFEDAYKTVSAKVVDVRYVKDRCRVDLEFTLAGQVCKKGFVLFNNQQTKYIHMDSEVTLIVKGENPKTSLIQELYFD